MAEANFSVDIFCVVRESLPNSCAPHSAQNIAPAILVCLQLGQTIICISPWLLLKEVHVYCILIPCCPHHSRHAFFQDFQPPSGRFWQGHSLPWKAGVWQDFVNAARLLKTRQPPPRHVPFPAFDRALNATWHAGCRWAAVHSRPFQKRGVKVSLEWAWLGRGWP